jgi:hypothetical protein
MDMEPAARGLAVFGFAFDPFEHLDSTKDAHLQEYLIIPHAVKITLSDQPVAIFAQPGGGKSALRMYAANFYRDSRGLKFPLTYAPETYSNAPRFHFQGIQRAIARAAFMYLASYPHLFFALTPPIKQTIKTLLLDIPFGLDFHLRALTESRFLSDLEQALGAPAFSNLPELGGAHRQLARDLEKETAFPKSLVLEDCFALLTDAFGTQSIHILIDGLDGFIETHASQALLAWIEPLLNVLEDWNRKNIYLKFFLPMDISDAPALTEQGVLRAAALTWDDNLLAEVVRRRVFVATRGAFDSLDAVSAPDLRNVELTLARQLGPKEKLPRQIILKCRTLLHKVTTFQREWIMPEDLLNGEALYAAI